MPGGRQRSDPVFRSSRVWALVRSPRISLTLTFHEFGPGALRLSSAQVCKQHSMLGHIRVSHTRIGLGGFAVISLNDSLAGKL